MKIIIVGAGIVGIQLAKRLIDENNDVAIIEKDEEAVKNAANSVDCMVINERGNNPAVLKQAGIEKTDYLICVTGSDELNMIICGMASAVWSRPVTIARVRNEEYLGSLSNGENSNFYHIDHIINPDKETAAAILRTIEYGVISDITLFEGTQYQMTGITVPEDSPINGKTVEYLRKNLGFDFLIGVVIRNSDYIIPSGTTVIETGDTVYVIASRENLMKFFSLSGKMKIPLKKIAIVGGGKIGKAIASYLLGEKKDNQSLLGQLTKFLVKGQGKAVTIVEKNYEKCKLLSERFPEALVLNADISDEGFSEENEFLNYDLIITTTENEELNLITSMYAKSQGTGKAVALVTQMNYVNIAYRLGIDVAISLKSCVVGSILKLVRRGGVKNTYTISDGKLEMVEVNLDPGSTVTGMKIRELKLPKDSLVLFITRGEDHIVPDGSYIFHEEDTVFIIARKDVLQKIEKLFGSNP